MISRWRRRGLDNRTVPAEDGRHEREEDAMGDIGTERREVEFEPVPDEGAPVEPAPVKPTPEPVKTPA
jgi:hypothetical protein